MTAYEVLVDRGTVDKMAVDEMTCHLPSGSTLLIKSYLMYSTKKKFLGNGIFC